MKRRFDDLTEEIEYEEIRQKENDDAYFDCSRWTYEEVR